MHRAILVSQNRYDRPGTSRASFRELGLKAPWGYSCHPLVQIPNDLSTSDHLVKQRITEGIGLIRGDIGLFSHALSEGFQDRDLLFACGFLYAEFVELGPEVPEGGGLRYLWVSIESALNDEEFCVSEPVYAE